MNWFLICLIAALSFAQLHAAEEKSAPAEKKEILKAVRLTPMATRIADLEIKVAGPASIAKFIEVPGEVTLNGDNLARVTPRLPGVATRILVKVGDKVSAGDTLAIVESMELGNAKSDYLAGKTVLDFAKVDLDRDQLIHDNTEKLLAVAASDPTPDEFEKAVASLSLGDVKSKILAASSALRLATVSFMRAEKLQGDNLISGAAFDSAKKDLGGARTEYRGVIEELKLNYKLRLLQSQRAVLTSTAALRNTPIF